MYQPIWPRPHSPLILVFKAIRRHSALTRGSRNLRGVNTLQFLESGNDVTDTAIHSTGFWVWQHSVLQQTAPSACRNDAIPETRLRLAISTLHMEQWTNTKQRIIPKCNTFWCWVKLWTVTELWWWNTLNGEHKTRCTAILELRIWRHNTAGKRQHCRMKKLKAVEPDRGRKSYWLHFATQDITWRVVTTCSARFNVEKFSVLPTQSIYVFWVYLRTNSDYFPIQH